MASFKIIPNHAKGTIALQILNIEQTEDGTKVPVLHCEHVFRADTFKKVLDAGSNAMQALQDAAEGQAAEGEIDKLEEEDLC